MNGQGERAVFWSGAGAAPGFQPPPRSKAGSLRDGQRAKRVLWGYHLAISARPPAITVHNGSYRLITGKTGGGGGLYFFGGDERDGSPSGGWDR